MRTYMLRNRLIGANRMAERPTSSGANLTTLARDLGLSRSTISRALRDHPAIPEATRRRVAAAAERAGYAPNARARGLAIGRTEAIGLVFPLERLQLTQTNFVDVLSGISEIVTQRNYSLLLSPFHDDEQAVLRKLVASKTVDGLIITRPLVSDPRIRLLHDLGVPFVVHGRSDIDVPYSFVDIRNKAVFERLAAVLLDYGHRRIAVLNADLRFRYAAARAAGFEAALAARGVLADAALSFETPMTEQSGYELARRLLAGDPRPTAFLCGSIFLARGVYRAAAEQGLRVGEDLSVVCHDDQLRGLNATDLDPPITATQQSVQAAGRRLAEILIELVEGNVASPPVGEILPVDLVLRSSIGLATS